MEIFLVLWAGHAILYLRTFASLGSRLVFLDACLLVELLFFKHLLRGYFWLAPPLLKPWPPSPSPPWRHTITSASSTTHHHHHLQGSATDVVGLGLLFCLPFLTRMTLTHLFSFISLHCDLKLIKMFCVYKKMHSILYTHSEGNHYCRVNLGKLFGMYLAYLCIYLRQTFVEGSLVLGAVPGV